MLHTVINLQKQSVNSGRTGEEAGTAEFTSVEGEEITRFQTLREARDHQGSASFPTATVTVTLIIQAHSEKADQKIGERGGGGRNDYLSRTVAKSQPDFVYKDIC